MNNLKSMKFDHLFKILIIGDSGVGKSCFILGFIKEYHSVEYKATIGIDVANKNIELLGKIIKLQIWDTAGQERFRTLTNNYYNGADAVLVVYDVNNKASFENVMSWINTVLEKAKPNITKILIGNKIDKNNRVISYDQGKLIAKEYKMSFYETSTKHKKNINNIFSIIAETLISSSNHCDRDYEIKRDSISLKKTSSLLTRRFCCL